MNEHVRISEREIVIEALRRELKLSQARVKEARAVAQTFYRAYKDLEEAVIDPAWHTDGHEDLFPWLTEDPPIALRLVRVPDDKDAL